MTKAKKPVKAKKAVTKKKSVATKPSSSTKSTSKKTKAAKPKAAATTKNKAKIKTKAKPKVSAKSKTSTKKVLAQPKGYNTVTPYIIVPDGQQAIEFYTKAFNAVEVMRMGKPDGKIGHAELKLGDSKVMLADECPFFKITGNSGAVSILLYVKDVDAIIKQAMNTGAKLVRAAENMFYGDRCGMIEDPFGIKWSLATHVEDVSIAQMNKRAQAMYQNDQTVS